MTSLNKLPDIVAILPAAGIGSRMHNPLPKQYLKINEKTILEHTIDALLCRPCIRKIIIAINANDRWYHHLPIANNPRLQAVTGGMARANSVMAALSYCVQEEGISWILVHDAVRPCLRQDDLNRLLAITSYTKVGGVLATPVRDAIKRVYTGSKIIATTVKRENLWHALTPQLFVKNLLTTCLEKALSEGISITDEASALEYYGYAPLLVQGHADNIKVTYQEDLALVSFLFSQLANTEIK